jgi:hypothetical protein
VERSTTVSVDTTAFGQFPIPQPLFTVPALPDPTLTPGAVDRRVTQANIASTICAADYLRTVQPSATVTSQLLDKTMAAYHRPGAPSDYQLDHLIGLSLGGAATDVKNVWPQSRMEPGRVGTVPDGYGAQIKDLHEMSLHAAVCAGRLTLAAAQQAEATDWRAALLSDLGVLKVGHPGTGTTVRPTTTP